jgi:Ca-activated chloride channel homolog
MDFAHPRFVWLALVITPMAAGFLWWTWRRKEAAIERFVRGRLRERLLIGVSPRRQILHRVLQVSALACLILALSRPRWGLGDEVARASGRDIVVCVDVSRSMTAGDVTPSRLTRAKLACYDLIHSATSDRLGLVAFAGSAFLQCPLALDEEAFRQNVAALDTDLIPNQGTAIGDALDEARGAFPADSAAQKAVILITDGEDHEDQALSAARRLARDGIKLFTIGVGTPNGELLKTGDPYGNAVFFKDEDGNPVKSRLNEALLGQIAEATGGFYLPLQSTRTMADLYQRGLGTLARTEFSATTVRQRIERFQWPLALGLLLLIVEMLLPEARGARADRRTSVAAPVLTGARGLAAAAAAVIALCALTMTRVEASPDKARTDYEQGRFAEARAEYERLAREKPDDLRLRFNAGAAAYREGDFKGAAGLFEQGLTAPDLGLQAQSWYNLGNARFQLGTQEEERDRKIEQWQQALSSYSSALKLNPGDPDARANLEAVQRAIEQLPQPPPQQQQQDGDDKKDSKKNDSKQEPQKNQNNKSRDKNQSQDRDEKDSQQQQDQRADQQKQESKDGENKDGSSQQAGQASKQNQPGQQKPSGADRNDPSKESQAGRQDSKPEPGKDGEERKPGEQRDKKPADKSKAGDQVARVAQGNQDQRGLAPGTPGAEATDGKDERKGTLMTIREAERLLDSARDEEKALVFRQPGPTTATEREAARRKQW